MTPDLTTVATAHLVKHNVPDSNMKLNIPEDVEEAAENFSSIFMGHFVSSLMDNLSSDGMMGGGKAEEVYRFIFSQSVAKHMANAPTGDPIKEAVTQELQKIIEYQQNNNPTEDQNGLPKVCDTCV